MVPKAKKEAPAPPKVEAKAKALKAKKAVLKGVHSHAHPQKICMSPTFPQPNAMADYPCKSTPRRKKLDHYAIIKLPLTTGSAMKKTGDNNIPVFIVDIKARKHQIKQGVKKLYDIEVAKVNNLIRPDGEKKAYVPLAPDYEALDVANKIESFIPSLAAPNVMTSLIRYQKPLAILSIPSYFKPQEAFSKFKTLKHVSPNLP
ncbi:large ribosomal subunit protein uL23-like [Saccopteryx bilineata]|uniref:large ribosomal subunit protein uL23-like n=1 Tax=Saccopteryx bilineata TaxID=59482 RepID=UPI00338D4B75